MANMLLSNDHRQAEMRCCLDSSGLCSEASGGTQGAGRSERGSGVGTYTNQWPHNPSDNPPAVGVTQVSQTDVDEQASVEESQRQNLHMAGVLQRQ